MTGRVGRDLRPDDVRKVAARELNLKGRHDPAIIRRICPVVSSLTAVVLCDALALRYGTDWLAVR